MFISEFKKERLVDTNSIPFERITKTGIQKARTVLAEIRKQIDKKSKLQLKFNQFRRNDKDSENYDTLFFELFTNCCKLSNDYYSLVPTFGFEFEKVPPIDNVHTLEQEEKKIKYLLEFETAKFYLGPCIEKMRSIPLIIFLGLFLVRWLNLMSIAKREIGLRSTCIIQEAWHQEGLKIFSK